MLNDSQEKRYVAVGALIMALAERGFFREGKVVLNRIKELYNRAAEHQDVDPVFSEALAAVPEIKSGFAEKLAIATVSTAAEKLFEAGFLIQRRSGSKTEYFLASGASAIEELESYDKAVAEAIPTITGEVCFGENYLPLPKEARGHEHKTAMTFTPSLVESFERQLAMDNDLRLRALIWSTADTVAIARRSALRLDLDLDDSAGESHSAIDRSPLAVYRRIQRACTELLATRRSFRRLMKDERFAPRVEVRETASWQSLPKLIWSHFAIAGEYFVSTSSHHSPGVRYSSESLHYARLRLDFESGWNATRSADGRDDIIALTQPLSKSDEDDPEWGDLVAVVWQSALDHWNLKRVAWRPQGHRRS